MQHITSTEEASRPAAEFYLEVRHEFLDEKKPH
jgi:hypothetical protein